LNSVSSALAPSIEMFGFWEAQRRSTTNISNAPPPIWLMRAAAAGLSSGLGIRSQTTRSMRGEITLAVMATWAARELPARLDVAQTAKLLGFAAHDIQILMGTGKLVPLGDPAPNAPKWFAAVLILRLAADEEWLRSWESQNSA
jgi:hypothetical protein